MKSTWSHRSLRVERRISIRRLVGAYSSRVAMLCLLGVALSLGGCLPIGWVTPPAKLEIAGGASSIQHSRTREDGRVTTTSRNTGALDMRVAASPLQAIEASEYRLIDLDVGYGWRYLGRQQRFQHGPFVGVGALVPLDALDARLFVGGRLQALIGSSQGGYDVLGNDAALRLGLDWSTWVSGPFRGCESDRDGLICVMGYTLGEAGVMPYLDLSRSQFLGEPQWTAMLGVSLRVPMSAAGGIVVINPLSLL